MMTILWYFTMKRYNRCAKKLKRDHHNLIHFLVSLYKTWEMVRFLLTQLDS
ncbi:hypothetical protein CHRY9293_03557 [Chryseobacterium potabilaquae]|uniref:Uncharacterized protein n=1 Tax=Chryseobacterium potabilaquae TaxID=2675057 RepID=A0A6N4X912_9FLAO|nr:hypothetical protein CHRY9293_03557 [Chryseobacterium potabilaquae]